MRREGFTLLELVMIFAIIAVMAVIVTPELSSLLTGWKLKQVIYKLKADISYAQQLAVTEARNKVIIFPEMFESDKSHYLICHGNSSCDEEIEPVSIDEQFEFNIQAMFPYPYLGINDYGEISGNIFGKINIKDTSSGKQVCLSVTRMGNVKILLPTECDP